jgi:hypothetical protein
LQPVWAASNAGEAELIPGTLTLNPPPFGVGSGKFDTPCERMQRAKLSPSCCAWAWVRRPPEFDGLAESEPQAAIIPAAAIAAVAIARSAIGLNVT